MSDATNVTDQEQWELDNEDPVMALWRMENEARARGSRGAGDFDDVSPRSRL